MGNIIINIIIIDIININIINIININIIIIITATISYGEAYELLNKYETACKTIRNYFPGAKDGKIILEETVAVLKKHGKETCNYL